MKFDYILAEDHAEELLDEQNLFRRKAEEEGFIYSIKINIPTSLEQYYEGNGEGCFVLVTKEAKEAYDNDEDKSVFVGILDDDSFYYKDLNHGEKIPFETRGKNRPVAIWKAIDAAFELDEEFIKGH